ncbi:response regulator transcription factor [bacterium]|nr:response regulator transcription factor [bacterium]
MARKHVLLVEDDEDILELLRYNLSEEGYTVDGAVTGEEALRLIVTKLPDLVILDLMLPGLDGMEVCKMIKRDPKTSHIPIVMLTAKSEDSDIVAGLELGADDYITKPFSPRVLIARVRAVLRRKSKEQTDETSTIQLHDLVINPGRHEVLAENSQVELTSTEFRVLHFLARRPGWVFTRNQIVEGVHGYDYPVTERSIDFQIASLRKKLGPAGKYIRTVRGVGYRFKD